MKLMEESMVKTVTMAMTYGSSYIHALSGRIIRPAVLMLLHVVSRALNQSMGPAQSKANSTTERIR